MSQPPDVFFTPVPDRVLVEMLRLAEVDPEDVFYDLGCGDGRIVIAALQAGARSGVGVDIDPACLTEATKHAHVAGVADRAEFREEDLFTTDLRPASVLALYLLDSLNVRLRPRIFAQCRPGTRVVTYSFEMGDWECDAHTPMAANGVSLWIVPANATGKWVVDEDLIDGPLQQVTIEQRYQRISGTAKLRKEDGIFALQEGRLRGKEITWRFHEGAKAWFFRGRIDGERLTGTLSSDGAESTWSATRAAGTPQPMIQIIS